MLRQDTPPTYVIIAHNNLAMIDNELEFGVITTKDKAISEFLLGKETKAGIVKLSSEFDSVGYRK